MKHFDKINYKLIVCLVLSAVLVVAFSIFGFASNKNTAANALNAKAQQAREVEEPEEAEASEESIDVREAQWSAFNVPISETSVIVTEQINRSPSLNHIAYDFEYLPNPAGPEQFTRLSNFAKSLLGVKYTAGGKNPSTGFDCSGFALYVLRSCGSEMTAASCEEQFKNCYEIPAGYEKPGDLVFFVGTGRDVSSPVLSHVGIYLGDNMMIHAGSAGICIVNITDEYWVQHFACFGRPTL